MAISQEEFKKLLKEKGLKVTNQRLLVLEVLADHRDTHMTAEDIYDLVKEDYPGDWSCNNLPDITVAAEYAVSGSY